MSRVRAPAAPPAAPPAASQSPPLFDDLYLPEQLQAANPHVFPSLPSLEWFMRMNRAELLEAGAIVELAGRRMLRGRRFVETAMEIGARRAAARGVKGAA